MLDLLECGMLFGADDYMKQHNSNTATKMARAIFTPAKVLKMVDNSDQGGCNISGAACYRTIQNLKKYDALKHCRSYYKTLMTFDMIVLLRWKNTQLKNTNI